jgi:hypothetical protein
MYTSGRAQATVRANSQQEVGIANKDKDVDREHQRNAAAQDRRRPGTGAGMIWPFRPTGLGPGAASVRSADQ